MFTGNTVLTFWAGSTSSLYFGTSEAFKQFVAEARLFFLSIAKNDYAIIDDNQSMEVSMYNKDGTRPGEGLNMVLKINNTDVKIPISDLFGTEVASNGMYNLNMEIMYVPSIGKNNVLYLGTNGIQSKELTIDFEQKAMTITDKSSEPE